MELNVKESIKFVEEMIKNGNREINSIEQSIVDLIKGK